MPRTHRAKSKTDLVIALYVDSILSFGLSSGSTLADLAECLDYFGERHIGMPTAVYLTLDVDQR